MSPDAGAKAIAALVVIRPILKAGEFAALTKEVLDRQLGSVFNSVCKMIYQCAADDDACRFALSPSSAGVPVVSQADMHHAWKEIDWVLLNRKAAEHEEEEARRDVN